MKCKKQIRDFNINFLVSLDVKGKSKNQVKMEALKYLKQFINKKFILIFNVKSIKKNLL